MRFTRVVSRRVLRARGDDPESQDAYLPLKSLALEIVGSSARRCEDALFPARLDKTLRGMELDFTTLKLSGAPRDSAHNT